MENYTTIRENEFKEWGKVASLPLKKICRENKVSTVEALTEYVVKLVGNNDNWIDNEMIHDILITKYSSCTISDNGELKFRS